MYMDTLPACTTRMPGAPRDQKIADPLELKQQAVVGHYGGGN